MNSRELNEAIEEAERLGWRIVKDKSETSYFLKWLVYDPEGVFRGAWPSVMIQDSFGIPNNYQWLLKT